MNENNKKLVVSLEPIEKKREVKTQKEKQKRQITTTSKWIFEEPELNYIYQWNLIKQIKNGNIIDKEECDFVVNKIKNIIYCYRSQDIDKNKLDGTKLINLENVIDLLITCENKCFYCKENVGILYEYVRESKQWTLDRLDNAFGHNNDNVVIACLSCNLNRILELLPKQYVT
jgi:hypothetical protein